MSVKNGNPISPKFVIKMEMKIVFKNQNFDPKNPPQIFEKKNLNV